VVGVVGGCGWVGEVMVLVAINEHMLATPGGVGLYIYIYIYISIDIHICRTGEVPHTRASSTARQRFFFKLYIYIHI
jgi:hypothetical protein